MSKVVIEDIQKASTKLRGKQFNCTCIKNQALSQKSSQFKYRKTWFCTHLCMFHRSALESHALSRYPGNRQNDRQTGTPQILF